MVGVFCLLLLLVKRLKNIIIITVITLLLGEGAVRVLGYQPFTPWHNRYNTEDGTPYFNEHPTYGYIAKPGQHTINQNHKNYFTITNNSRGYRITSLSKEYDNKPEIWVFGCSFTNGWMLNDDETFCWLAQKELPDYKIKNYGLPSYSNLQSLLQLEDLLKTKAAPKLIILNFAWFHNIRNTYVRYWEKSIAPIGFIGNLQVPYARLNDTSYDIKYKPLKYHSWPLVEYSAFVHFLETNYNHFEDHNMVKSYMVTSKILQDFNRICRDKNILVVIANIDGSEETKGFMEHLQKKGITTADISVDLTIPENTFLPDDPHPTTKANREIAEKLIKLIQNKLD